MTTNRARDSITKPVVIVPTAAKMKGDPATHCGASDTLLKAGEHCCKVHCYEWVCWCSWNILCDVWCESCDWSKHKTVCL